MSREFLSVKRTCKTHSGAEVHALLAALHRCGARDEVLRDAAAVGLALLGEDLRVRQAEGRHREQDGVLKVAADDVQEVGWASRDTCGSGTTTSGSRTPTCRRRRAECCASRSRRYGWRRSGRPNAAQRRTARRRTRRAERLAGGRPLSSEGGPPRRPVRARRLRQCRLGSCAISSGRACLAEEFGVRTRVQRHQGRQASVGAWALGSRDPEHHRPVMHYGAGAR